MAIKVKIINIYPALGGCNTLISNLITLNSPDLKFSLIHNSNSKSKFVYELTTYFSLMRHLILFRRSIEVFIAIHMFSSLGLVKNIIYSILCQKPFLIHLSGSLDYHYNHRNGIYKFFTEFLLKCSDGVICLNETSFKIASKLNNNTFLVPNFIGNNQKEIIDKELSKNYEKIFHFSYHGRLTVDKGLYNLLQIIKSLNNFRFVIIGDGDKELINKLKHLNNVTFIDSSGNISLIVKYLIKSEVYLFPSNREGLPFALLEAMSCGLPIISNKFNDVEDIVRDQKSGMIVNTNKIEPTILQVRKFILNASKLEQMGKFNIHLVNEYYSEKNFLDSFKLVIDCIYPKSKISSIK
jgi:glycosyltransferase involved in cell wall biosynthesis